MGTRPSGQTTAGWPQKARSTDDCHGRAPALIVHRSPKPGSGHHATTGVIACVSDALQHGLVQAEEVVRTALARIESRNRDLNAVVALRADEALKEARAVDAGFRRGAAVGRLAGIPVLVKESEHVAGMRTSRGSVLFADSPAAIREE